MRSWRPEERQKIESDLGFPEMSKERVLYEGVELRYQEFLASRGEGRLAVPSFVTHVPPQQSFVEQWDIGRAHMKVQETKGSAVWEGGRDHFLEEFGFLRV